MRAKPRPSRRTSTTPSSLVARPSSGKSSRSSSSGSVLFALAVASAASSSAGPLVEAQGPRLRLGDVGRSPLRRRFEHVELDRVHVVSSRPQRAAGRAAADQPPGQRAGRLPVAVRDVAADDRRAVAMGALEQPLASGRQVVGHHGHVAAQVVEIDDVDVRPHARGDDAPVREPDGAGVRARELRATMEPTVIRPCERSRVQWESA